jgi:hypothetical protein
MHYANARECRWSNNKWTIQRNWPHRAHKTRKNKAKTQLNMCRILRFHSYAAQHIEMIMMHGYYGVIIEVFSNIVHTRFFGVTRVTHLFSFMCRYVLSSQKHNSICVGYHYAQANTNNVNKT